MKNEKLSIGKAAYDAEYLNLPSDDGNLVSWDDIRYYEESEIAGDVPNMEIAGFFDPSATGTETSDCQGIVAVGRIARDGKLIHYVLDTFIKKAKLDEAVRVVYEKAKKFPRAVFGVETNVFSDWLKKEFDTRANETKRAVSWKPVKHHGKSKQERIRWLAPLIERGEIRFLKTQEDLLHQLAYFGDPGVHDDGADALAGCFEVFAREPEKKSEPMVFFTGSPTRGS